MSRHHDHPWCSALVDKDRWQGVHRHRTLVGSPLQRFPFLLDFLKHKHGKFHHHHFGAPTSQQVSIGYNYGASLILTNAGEETETLLASKLDYKG